MTPNSRPFRLGVANRAEALRIGWWKCVNRGDRTGKPNDDALFDSKGDPMGGLAVISISVVTRSRPLDLFHVSA